MSGSDETPDNVPNPGGQEPPAYGGQPSDPGPYGAPPPPYGTPPPPPPYDPNAAIGGPAPYNGNAALSFGWKKFTENLGPILIFVVLWLAASAAVNTAITFVTTGGSAFDFDVDRGVVNPMAGVNLFASGIQYLVSLAVATIGQAIITKGALDVTHGRKFALETLFQGLNWGQLILATLILSVTMSIGYMLCFLPGVVVGFLTMFTLHFIIDKNLDAIDAIKASYQLVVDNLSNALLWAVVAFAVTLVGLLACCVGLVAALPVVVIGTAYTFRTLLGEQVAA